MTVQELYDRIGGDYEAAKKIMMMDQIIGRMIVKYTDDSSCAALNSAVETMDPGKLVESAHTLKGVSANLGLKEISSRASILADEFRPGRSRTMSDDQVREKVNELTALDRKAKEGIREFAGA